MDEKIVKDCISRQAAIHAICRDCVRLERGGALMITISTAKQWAVDLLGELPSAQPEQSWIPCGERLPDRFGEMLVTFIPAAGTLWTRVIIAHYSDLMGIAKPCFWIGNVGKSDFANITSQVVAWMPLPEPYREDES